MTFINLIGGFARPSRLRNLEFLNFHGNNFNNSILTSIGGFLSLKSLDLSNNDIKGVIHFSSKFPYFIKL